jgi:hypothetical protein
MKMNYQFSIISPKYGLFTVTAPERFRTKIEKFTWSVIHQPNRCKDSVNFSVATHTYDASGRRTLLYLYRLIYDLAGHPPTPIIDHKDGDSLNNSERNLRAANYKQNGCNRGLSRTNTSGVKGVYWNKRDECWLAYIGVNGKKIYLGSFDTPIEGAVAYNNAAVKYHGEFARLNVIGDR